MDQGGVKALRTERCEELAGPSDFFPVDRVPHTGIDPLLDLAAENIHDVRGFMDSAHRDVRIDVAAAEENRGTLEGPRVITRRPLRPDKPA